ncbi:MAG: hypothetical protein CMJ74_08695 [Planctomycetaceae bacterium]|nr:hypothetical protein [Planctomycetaceae bacterium]
MLLGCRTKLITIRGLFSANTMADRWATGYCERHHQRSCNSRTRSLIRSNIATVKQKYLIDSSAHRGLIKSQQLMFRF